jgi:hypothetical protein
MFEFLKNMQVETLAAVPEKYHGLYEENPEGGFRVTEAAKGIVTDYAGTTTALAEATGKTKSANDESAARRIKLKAFEEFAKENGFEGEDSLEAIKAGVTNLTGQIKGGEAAKVNLDKVTQDWQNRLKEVEESKSGEVSKMRGSLERYLIGQAGTEAIAKAKGSVDLLLPILSKHARVAQDGDDYVVRVVDDGGENRLNGSGGFMTVSDLVTEMKADANFGRAFDSESPGGTGTPPGGGMRKPTESKGDLAANEKITAGLNSRLGTG